MPLVSPYRSIRAFLFSCFALLLAVFVGGCGRFHHDRHDTVYVSARQMYLRDRVAAVSNRVGEVSNGEKLEVLEHGRRFLKVKTPKNEIGWIEQHAVIDGKVFDAFDELAGQHKQDPVIASATLRDDLYLHIRPGRDTEHFYLLPGNAKVQLLIRASVPKASPPGFALLPKTPAPSAQTPSGAAKTPASAPKPGTKQTLPAVPAVPVVSVPPPPPIMEDWWLVRDGQGRAGWVLASRVDVDVPDEIGVYAEGQRIVGAYVIAKVTDDEATTPNHEVPEYITVLSPPKSGLPFDFDQVRVFTWSIKRHRYETGFRLHPIQGYLPVKITSQPGPGGSVPGFGFQIGDSQHLLSDPQTGITRPANPRTINYVLLDTQVKRVGPDTGPIPITHSEDDPSKDKNKAKKADKKRR